MKYSRKTLFLLASGVFHFLVLIFLGFGIIQPQIESNQKTEIQVLYKKSNARSNLNPKNGRPENQKKLSLQSLLQKNNYFSQNYSTKKQVQENQLATEDKFNWRAKDHYEQNLLSASDGISQGQVKYLDQLWKEIDKSIWDSELLSEFNHTGQIFLNFKIDVNNNLIESSLRACGEDRILKVIATRALRKALADKNQWLINPEPNTEVFARFNWSNYTKCAELHGRQKNYLSFCHYAENKRKTFSAAEKATTYLESLNYGFGALEEIENYHKAEKRRRDRFDPFEDFERDPDANLEC